MPTNFDSPQEEEKLNPSAVVAEQPQSLASKLPFIIGGLGLAIIILLSAVGIIPTAKLFLPPPAGGPAHPQVPTQVTEKPDKYALNLKTLDLNQVLSQSINYIKSQRTPDGYYHYLAHFNDLCQTSNGKKVCPLNGNILKITNSWAMLAYFGAYQAYPDSTYQDSINQDFSKLNEYCSQDINECLWGITQPALIYQSTKDPLLLDFLKKAGEALLKKSDPSNLMLLSIEARELSLLYQITQDHRFLQEAEKRLVMAENNLSVDETIPLIQTPFPKRGCWYTAAVLEMAKSGKPGYRDRAITVLNSANFSQNANHFISSLQIQPCIESYLMLYQQTNRRDYLNSAQKLNDYLLNYFWDGQDNQLLHGEGGTTSLVANKEPASHNIDKYVTLTDSAYTAYLQGLILNILAHNKP